VLKKETPLPVCSSGRGVTINPQKGNKMSEHLKTMAEVLEIRNKSINPVGKKEMAKVLETVMLIGFKIGVNQGIKYENSECTKKLRSLEREIKRSAQTPWFE
tara:strand:- start:1365 stop:1670 length:306 start_codon:yes stop_codon:yes gene_type:complete